MSDTTPTPDIPKPSIPKPDIPKPQIPTPNLDRASAAPPMSAVETGGMEAPQPQGSFEEEASEIEYSETLLPQRILAGVIDSLVAMGLMVAADRLLPDFLGVVPIALSVAYLLFKDSLAFLGGQSVGKKVTKIQAVTAEGEPLTRNLQKGILRNVSAAILPLAIAEIFVLHTREKQANAGLRLGDDFAKTKVVAVNETQKEVSEEG